MVQFLISTRSLESKNVSQMWWIGYGWMEGWMYKCQTSIYIFVMMFYRTKESRDLGILMSSPVRKRKEYNRWK